MSVHDFVQTIQFLSTRYSFSVTSWIRSPKRNMEKSGHPNSFHLYGLAVDVILDDPREIAGFLAACKRFHVRAIDEVDHIHLQVI